MFRVFDADDEDAFANVGDDDVGFYVKGKVFRLISGREPWNKEMYTFISFSLSITVNLQSKGFQETA